MILWILLSAAHGFGLNETAVGEPLRWAEMPVMYQVDATSAPSELDRGEQIDAVRGAMDAWSNIKGSDAELVEGEVDPWGSQEAGLVYWEPDWPWDPAALALTSTWSTESGEIVGFEMAINASADVTWSTDGAEGTFDLQNAITHEVGHVLGLGHNNENSWTTMYPTTEQGETLKRGLHWDDEDGARFLYPRAIDYSLPVDELVGCSTVGSASSLWALALPLVALALRRRD